MKSRGELTIGEIADHFGLATHVLRHWESMGLLAPARAVAGRRRYGTVDIYRVAVILHAKRAGFALDDIRAIVTATSPAQRREVLRRQRDNLIQRIAQAQTALTLTDAALSCRHGDIATCPRFQALLTEQIQPLVGGR